MSQVFQILAGVDFDATASNIQIRNDRLGATVRTVEIDGRVVRVLAHTDEDAQAAAREWLADQSAVAVS